MSSLLKPRIVLFARERDARVAALPRCEHPKTAAGWLVTYRVPQTIIGVRRIAKRVSALNRRVPATLGMLSTSATER
jgi:hypothetical protein